MEAAVMSGYVTVEIYCDDLSHDERRWVVEQFAKTGPAEWLPDPSWKLRRGHATHQRIDVGRGEAITSASGVAPNTEIRDRYSLRCHKCGLSVTVRGERLGVILDGIADADVSELSLARIIPVTSTAATLAGDARQR
jgi:hypothetical protein